KADSVVALPLPALVGQSTGPGSFPTLKARLGAVLLLLLAAAGWYLFTSLGHILHHEDPLEHADVIFVLSGTRVERVAEAGELYLAGWAPRVLLSRQIVEPAE